MDLDLTCSRCDGRGHYYVEGLCGNCSTRFRLKISKSHEKPGSYSGATCTVCGCSRVIGLELLTQVVDDEAELRADDAVPGTYRVMGTTEQVSATIGVGDVVTIDSLFRVRNADGTVIFTLAPLMVAVTGSKHER